MRRWFGHCLFFISPSFDAFGKAVEGLWHSLSIFTYTLEGLNKYTGNFLLNCHQIFTYSHKSLKHS